MKKHYVRKRSFLHIKSFVYSSIIIFLLFSLYGVYFFTSKYHDEYEGLIMNNEHMVQADYIAKVIDFNGSFYIEHKGKRVQTSMIHDGDIVTLKENTQFICQINTGTKAKLIGPAKFSIEQVSNGKTPKYKLNVMQGNFIEMKSDSKTSEQIQLTINNKLTVQQANGKAIDYQLIKAGETHVVKNNGGTLSVTTIDKNNNEKKTQLNSAQVLAIEKNDIKLFDNIKKFAEAIKKNNVSQTFTLNSSKENLTGVGGEFEETDLPEEISLTSLLTITDEKIDQDISNQLSSLFSKEEKVVVSINQYKAIPSIDFIKLLTDDIYQNRFKGQEKELAIAYINLEMTIARLAEAFNVSYQKPSSTSIQENIIHLKKILLEIINVIKNGYIIPEKYISNLDIFISKLDTLSKEKFGEEKEIGEEKK